MKSIYHHTSFKVLKSIVTDTGLNFRASKYSNYTNGEYEWIKFNPYIICFCGENLSREMWLNYVDSGNGIQIGVNTDIISSFSLKERDPDVLFGAFT